MLNVVTYLFLSHMKGLNQMCLWLVRRSFPECIWCWGGSISVCVISKTYWPDGRLHGSITCHLPVLKECLLLFCPQTQRHITDLYEDLRDGHNLISLLEVLSGETLVSSWWPLTFRYQDICFCCTPPSRPVCPVQTSSSRPCSSVTWFAVITVLLSPVSSL